MHELSVTENILEIANRHASEKNAKKVTQINIVIGQLSSIVNDSVQFYWDIFSKDTICEDAKLFFTRVPAKLECLDCGNQYTIETELRPCPKCNSVKIKVVSGEEFWLDSIEIEV